MEEDRDVEFESSMRERNYYWMRKLLDFVLTFSAYDPIAVFEAERGSASTQPSWLRRNWMKISILITVYLSLKPTAIFVLRSVRAHSSLDFVDQPTWLDWLLSHLGDAYSSLHFSTLLIYMWFPFCAIWTRCYLPIHFKYYQAYDCPFARFMLDPEREVRQFDQRSCEMLDQVIASFEPHQRKFSDAFCFEHDVRALAGSLRVEIRRNQQQIDQMRLVRHQIRLIRPKALAVDWHRQSCKNFPLTFVVFAVLSLLIAMVFCLYYTYLAWLGRCRELRGLMVGENPTGEIDSLRCSMREAFTFAELSVIAEINLLGHVCILFSGSLVTVLHLFQVAHHLHLITSITRKLLKVLNELNADRKLGVHEAYTDESGLSARLSANLICVWMFERDARKSLSMLTHSCRYAVACYFLLTIGTFASINDKAIDEKHLLPSAVAGRVILYTTAELDRNRLMVISAWLSTWVYANGILLSCAVIPAWTAKLHRLIYSLVGQLVRVQEEHRNAIELEYPHIRQHCDFMDDPITSLWRRLVLTGYFKSDQHAVTVYTNKIIYERVLAINFYVVTLISLVTVYSR